MTSMLQSLWKTIVSLQTGKTEDDFQAALQKNQFDGQYQKYMSKFDHNLTLKFNELQYEEKKKERVGQGKTQEMVNAYYDIATDFYEYGWGQSFHFAPRFAGEEFHASIARHEYFLAYKMQVKKGQTVLDVGCGVGGPLRNISRFTGCNVVGLNNNAYQVRRGTTLCRKAGLADRCQLVKGDFMNIPFDANTFDHIYAIEATCHAPDRTGVFKQIIRVLKEGGHFGVYEWVMTDKYDDKNPKHRSIKNGIEEGNGIPALITAKECRKNLKDAGFEIIDDFDLVDEAIDMGSPLTWYASFESGCTLSQIKHTKLGRLSTQLFVDVLETLKIAPAGTSGTHRMLANTADALVESGRLEIFTPMHFFLCRKPVSTKK